MRFSVLLPTRNGAAFLKGCIESVLAQSLGPEAMELVISDNASEDGTPEVIAPYRGDPRVKYERLAASVPVTQNWNKALERARGEYVLLIGDDDALMPDCLAVLDRRLRDFGDPEALGFNGHLYVAPGSIFDNDTSYAKTPYHPYFEAAPVVLSPEKRMELVRKMFRFEQLYPLNMQLTVFTKKIGDALRGGIFQPPFPDHYGLNALLIEAKTFVTTPDQLAVIGVSPKSFGHYYFSNDQKEGMRHLGEDSLFPGRLPGDEIFNSMYRWLLLLKKNYPDLLAGFEIDRGAYEDLQIKHWKKLLEFGQLGLARALRLAFMLPFGRAFGLVPELVRTSRAGKARAAQAKKPRIEDVLPIERLEGVKTISDFIARAQRVKA